MNFFRKKAEDKKPAESLADGGLIPEASTPAFVAVLGSGCAKCNALEAAAAAALQELGMDTRIDHIREFEKIAAYGVMSTPALVVNGKVVSTGRVLSKDEVIAEIKKLGA